ncbi:hypothetical protein BCR37DRAFT_387219 [Protomyces lactucae-debilis]|uniref:Hexosyltransferase n=1 Tax=Protomyces lactucae-debilis TaxID=2754530 RepID=A0A1Y2FF26_PROLT|nr:uncharacterized protein BCR37DRAFT_387219 [Protomyces lactucae-debilis]ORY82512.1 hypothetical protein BCR37DRAFT_387219 [Protomyces lactucae-debilis]
MLKGDDLRPQLSRRVRLVLLTVFLFISYVSMILMALRPFPSSRAGHFSQLASRITPYKERARGLRGVLVPAQAAISSPAVALFIGIHSPAHMQDRRDAARKGYNDVLASGVLHRQDIVVIRHVLCRDGETATQLAEEQKTHGDLLILNCTAGDDSMKTWHYFQHISQVIKVADHVNHSGSADLEFDFVMKLSHDAYQHLPMTLSWLRPYVGVPRLYAGRLAQHNETLVYQTGDGYVLSKDLCLWWSANNTYSDPSAGFEDVNMRLWLDLLNQKREPIALLDGGWRFYPLDKRIFCQMASPEKLRDPQYLKSKKGRETVHKLLTLDDLQVHHLKTPESFDVVARTFLEKMLAPPKEAMEDQRHACE